MLYNYAKIGDYLELSEDQTSERHQELLAEFERRKKVNIQQLNITLDLETFSVGIMWLA